MITVTADIDIDRPLPEVFAFLEDVENNPKWLRGMKSCTWTSEPPVGVGSTYDQRAVFLGKEIVSSFVVTEHEPRKRVTIKTTKSSFPLTVTRTTEAVASGRTHVHETVEGDPRGFYRMAQPLLRLVVQRNVRRDYGHLKRLLETGQV
ncbi:MAG: SRPBCC family protein [Acidimicrobiia bacterium]